LELDVAPFLKVVDRTVRRSGRVGSAEGTACSLAVLMCDATAIGVGRRARFVADLARDNFGEQCVLLNVIIWEGCLDNSAFALSFISRYRRVVGESGPTKL